MDHRCTNCNRSLVVDNPPSPLCPFCEDFDGTCPGCDAPIKGIVEHECKECRSFQCECNCPSKILRTVNIPVTLDIKIAYHEDGRMTWDVFPTLAEAVRAWEFGNPRFAAHHWDREVCHIYHDEMTDAWHLLYL